ncbi:hypothetical protein ONR75_18465 [Rhodopseudomonas sp. P2A-2r]|uniref:hypothetical protein n=1 Tax=Rhodopseudomonas sp. P2A-2r TaxID=2991972 RepID=UPI00223418F2|nr:hypothetical protein [Rhodopseudomonas sp. P2A-2r]UZE46989.1 hypothetical protein ONR75_18465 [Rhodopseudomonas sp. P2A-2r]
MDLMSWDSVAVIKSLDWPGFVKTVLGAGAGAAIVAWYREHRAKKERATYIALRAAIALENYAISCWRLVFSGRAHYEQTGSPLADAVPELIGMPSDADWKEVDSSLTNEALSFANTVSIAQILSDHSRFFEGNPFEAETSAKERGRDAWLISERLRRRYKLTPRDEEKKRLEELFE